MPRHVEVDTAIFLGWAHLPLTCVGTLRSQLCNGLRSIEVTAPRLELNVRFGPIRMPAPQSGQRQTRTSAGADAVAVRDTGDSPISSRAITRSWVRCALAKNPKCLIRTNPRGRTCRTNRRRNSLALTVILRFLLPCMRHSAIIQRICDSGLPGVVQHAKTIVSGGNCASLPAKMRLRESAWKRVAPRRLAKHCNLASFDHPNRDG